jgi:hypothetical protein
LACAPFYAAARGTGGCGSGKKADQHQRRAIKYRQQHVEYFVHENAHVKGVKKL